MKSKNVAVFTTALLALMALSPLDLVGATNSSLEIQGDDVYGSVGPHTTLCEFSDPSDCAENHFDAGTSAHIGDSQYIGDDDPWAVYEVVLNEKPDCVEEENLRVVFRYQLNNVWHGFGDDHDVYVKLRDWGQAEGEYDLLDSTVNTETSSGIQGTLDSSNETSDFGHGTSFFTGSTRSFSKSSILATSENGVYLEEHGSSQSKIHVRISANPGEAWGVNYETRIEVDWLRVDFSSETEEPTNPSNPTFQWEEVSMLGGPTTSGWFNSLGSEVQVRFGSGASDACEFSRIEYMWKDISSGPPPSSSLGTEIYPDDSANSIFSGIPTPTESGSWRFWFRAVDALDNKAPWVSTDAIDFDYTEPQLPTIPEDSRWYNGTDEIALTWLPASDTFSGVSKYNITQSGVGGVGFVEHESDIEQYTFQLQTDILHPGVNEFQITATDGAQPSPNSETKSIEIHYDPYPPVVNPPIVENAKFTVSRPVIEWSHPLAFESAIGESGVFSCQLTIDSIEVSNIPVSECTNDSGLVTLLPLEDGPHSLTITACDFARNCGTGAFRNFTIDATLPSLSEVSVDPSDDILWHSKTRIQVSASFSDYSDWGVGSGIDRVWHGFYLEGVEPSISGLKKDYPAASICEDVCITHDLNKNFEVPSDGTWMWYYVVKDKAGSESIGHSPLITKLDTTNPFFIDGPNLDVSSNGNLEASWEADDEHSGIYGYLFALDSCDFGSSTLTSQTSYSFGNVTDSHFICIKAIDRAGNAIKKEMDSADPFIECPSLSIDDGFNRQPSTITCRLNDDSAINLHDGIGSVEQILLDDQDITHLISYTNTSEVNEFSFGVEPMEIGLHHLQINALDRHGRECQYKIDYYIIGEGIKIELINGSYLGSEASLSFHWDKEDLDSFFGNQLRVSGVNVDSLDKESLKEYFDVNSYRYDDPLKDVVTLDFKPSVIPNIGVSTIFTFTIDDTHNSEDYILYVTVDPCPSTHELNSTSDLCEKTPTSIENGPILAPIPFLALIILLVIGGILYRTLRGEK
jgi:hypothetical protein